jgi:hypothetical protein
MLSAETLRETDEAGEITRLDGYHEEVLLLFKFILVLITYFTFSFNAIEKTWEGIKEWVWGASLGIVTSCPAVGHGRGLSRPVWNVLIS